MYMHHSIRPPAYHNAGRSYNYLGKVEATVKTVIGKELGDWICILDEKSSDKKSGTQSL
jgi:hypothetical protein